MMSFAVMLARATRLAACAGRTGCDVADASWKPAGAAAGFDGAGAGSSSGLTNVATVLDVADATWKLSDLAAGFAVADATVSDLAGRDCGTGTAASLSADFSAGFAAVSGFAGAAATTLGLVAAALAGVVAVSTCSSSSAPPPPNSLARKLGLRLTLACATAVPLTEPLSEAKRLPSCPFDITRASCASGIRGQWRTLPVSMCTKPDEG